MIVVDDRGPILPDDRKEVLFRRFKRLSKKMQTALIMKHGSMQRWAEIVHTEELMKKLNNQILKKQRKGEWG